MTLILLFISGLVYVAGIFVRVLVDYVLPVARRNRPGIAQLLWIYFGWPIALPYEVWVYYKSHQPPHA